MRKVMIENNGVVEHCHSRRMSSQVACEARAEKALCRQTAATVPDYLP